MAFCFFLLKIALCSGRNSLPTTPLWPILRDCSASCTCTAWLKGIPLIPIPEGREAMVVSSWPNCCQKKVHNGGHCCRFCCFFCFHVHFLKWFALDEHFPKFATRMVVLADENCGVFSPGPLLLRCHAGVARRGCLTSGGSLCLTNARTLTVCVFFVFFWNSPNSASIFFAWWLMNFILFFGRIYCCKFRSLCKKNELRRKILDACFVLKTYFFLSLGPQGGW